MAGEKLKNFEIWDLLAPRGITGKVLRFSEKPEDVRIIIRDLICSDKHYRFNDSDNQEAKSIKKAIADYYTVKDKNQLSSDDVRTSNFFNAISNKHGVVHVTNPYDDSKFWKMNLSTTAASFNDFFPGLFDPVKTGFQCDVVMMNSRDSFISPGTANTEDVELFLNYTPSHIANRLVPYLEVEFESNKTYQTYCNDSKAPDALRYLNTPSMMRFLLGSVDSEQLTKEDKSILMRRTEQKQILSGSALASNRNPNAVNSEFTSKQVTSMEMFLSPQSMTNMDALKSNDHTSRLMDVKPFLPIASIMDFEVNIRNAGAGDMVTASAKMTIKLPDKARLPEFSAFLRGPVGYASSRIWTSYGWLAPLSAPEDEYSQFINNKMSKVDCWSVQNSQFSFDQYGGVTLNLQLLTDTVSRSRQTSIRSQTGSLQSFLDKYRQLIEEIAEESRIQREQGLGPESRFMQLLNTGAQGKLYGEDPEKVEKDVDQIIAGHQATGAITVEKANELRDKLKSIVSETYDNQGHPTRRGLSQRRAETVVDVINQARAGADPFLPTLESINSNKAVGYFNTRYIEELKLALEGKKQPDVVTAAPPSPPPKAKAAKAAKATPPKKSNNQAPATPQKPERLEIQIDKKPEARIVSFGKIFMSTILPAYLNANSIDLAKNEDAEVQVIFYPLNDTCGPVSDQSVAEFAIDTERLAYMMDDQLKATSKHDFTIHEFLKVLVNSQFKDDRAIGYGRVSRNLYKDFDRNNPKAEANTENEHYQSNLAAWQAENPTFTPPMIEMVIENQAAYDDTSSRIHRLIRDARRGSLKKINIVRIHVYDRTASPRKIFSKLVRVGSAYELGYFDDRKFRESKKTDPNIETKLDNWRTTLSKAQNSTPDGQRAAELQVGSDAGIELVSPLGGKFPIKIERKLFGKGGIRDSLRMLAPMLDIGSNGSLITSVNLASKTDDLAAAAHMTRQHLGKKSNNQNSVLPPPTGLEDAGGLPIRVAPGALNITCLGTPVAKLYQSYFVDLGTGTTIDAIYSCNTITHKITQGKFETSMTFNYLDGYGKFEGAASIARLLGPPKPMQKPVPPPPPAPPAPPPPAPAPPPPPKPAKKPGIIRFEYRKEYVDSARWGQFVNSPAIGARVAAAKEARTKKFNPVPYEYIIDYTTNDLVRATPKGIAARKAGPPGPDEQILATQDTFTQINGQYFPYTGVSPKPNPGPHLTVDSSFADWQTKVKKFNQAGFERAKALITAQAFQ